MRQSKSLVMLAGTALTLGVVGAAEPVQNDEVRAVVAEMIADAETRSSMLAGSDAGRDEGGFFIAGEGYRLNIGGGLQFRYLANFRDDDNVDDFEPGFQTRRSWISFRGFINENWSFEITGDFEIEDSFGLEDAWAGYKFANGVKVRWGQFKLPLLREELIGADRQLAGQRSLTNDVFSQDWATGVEFTYEQEDWRAFGAFSDGLRSRNTDFNNAEPNIANNFAGNNEEADYAFTGRADIKFAGEWRQADDFTSMQGDPFFAMLGLAAHWQESANSNSPADVDEDIFQFTGDISLEGAGWNAYGAFIGRYTDLNTLSGDNDFFDFGGIIQAGVRVTENTELFGRWDGLFVDEDRGTDDDNFHFLTVGVNQYYAGHAAKATIDVVYAFNETDDLVGLGVLPNSSAGLIGDTEDGEFVARLQFQLLF
jgi:hypothetical protein